MNYKERRNKLAESFSEKDLLFFPGNTFSPKNYRDNYYRFRQDSTFLYYTGMDLPDLSLIVDGASGKSYLFGNEVTVSDIVWTGWQPSLKDLAQKIAIEEVHELSTLDDFLQRTKNSGRTIHYLPPYRGETQISLAHCLTMPVADVSENASSLLVDAVLAQREIKSEDEIVEMEKALTITREMHLEMLYNAKSGATEAQVLAGAIKIAEENQVALAYPGIVTVNGEILHNHYHGNVLKEGDLLLCDVGAESPGYYAADITRTYPVSLTLGTQQRAIYQLVLDMLNYSTAELRPGIPYRDVHIGSTRVMIEGLKEMGLMHGDTEEALKEGAGALFFPHGLGHMIGLDVHDMENLGEDRVGYGSGYERGEQFGIRSLRFGKKLLEGHVLTVEPGIYFIEALINQWGSENRYLDFINYSEVRKYIGLGGVRLEDNYLITENGSKLLGPPIPIQIDEIEFLKSTTVDFGGATTPTDPS